MKNKFKILSIDGGGIRGVFPAMFLAEFEENLKNKGVEKWQVYQNFNLICGTSTGGILAIALSLGIPAKEIYEMYLDNAKTIFGNKKPFFKQLWNSSYKRDNLEKVVRRIFKENFNDGEDPRLINCKTPTMIPIYDLDKGKGSVLKSPYHNKLGRDKHIPLFMAAMATSAAPTYFDPYSSTYTDLEGKKRTFNNKVDGGVWVNNPTLNAIIETQKAFNKSLNDLAVLSIGTGYQKFIESGIKNNSGFKNWTLKKLGLKGSDNSRKNYGLWYWMIKDRKKRVIDLFMQGQSQQTENLISLLQRGIDKQEKDNFYYTRIKIEFDDSTFVKMDETDKKILISLAEKASKEFQEKGMDILKVFGNK